MSTDLILCTNALMDTCPSPLTFGLKMFSDNQKYKGQ